MQPVFIQNRIYEVRNLKVMFDFDLAELYEVDTKVLNQSIKRNITRFPEDFMFRLTAEEWDSKWSQFVTTSLKYRGKSYLPYAFTEHGVTMLASVLRSERAIRMNIAIVRAFIELRKLSLDKHDISGQLKRLRNELYDRLGNQDEKLTLVYKVIEKLVKEKASQKKWEERERIGFKN